MNNFLDAIQTHKKVIENLDGNFLKKIDLASKTLVKLIKDGGTIFWCGNGGSASQASHLSAELVGGMYKHKVMPISSLCLNSDTAFITAWSNDVNYNDIFLRQLQSLSSKGDALITLSTSGNSENILLASEYAKQNNIFVLSLTGQQACKMDEVASLSLKVPSNCTQRIQEVHILAGHLICDYIEKNVNL